jgi:putative transposase
LFDVSTRTVQSRFLLRPSLLINEIVAGILARVQHLYGMSICAFVCLSNHYHLLLRVDNAKQLSEFMTTSILTSPGRWAAASAGQDKFWPGASGRSSSARKKAPRSAPQVPPRPWREGGTAARLREWPGLHAVRAILDDEPIEGYWFDRTQEYHARRLGEDFDRLAFATRETVVLSPLPCWEHLSPAAQRERIAEVVREIETEAQEERQKAGKFPMGATAIRRQNPHAARRNRRNRPRRSSTHSAGKLGRHSVTPTAGSWPAFREAAQRLKEGDRTALFPDGCFPPALPVVRRRLM